MRHMDLVMFTYPSNSLHRIGLSILQYPMQVAYGEDFVIDLMKKSANYYQNIDFSDFCIVRTLLSKVLSDFHQIYALLSTIDLLDQCLQITGAEHGNQTCLLLIPKCLVVVAEVSRWIFCYEKLKAASFDKIQSFNQLYDQSDFI